jgi:hypothetical protein
MPGNGRLASKPGKADERRRREPQASDWPRRHEMRPQGELMAILTSYEHRRAVGRRFSGRGPGAMVQQPGWPGSGVRCGCTPAGGRAQRVQLEGGVWLAPTVGAERVIPVCGHLGLTLTKAKRTQDTPGNIHHNRWDL